VHKQLSKQKKLIQRQRELALSLVQMTHGLKKFIFLSRQRLALKAEMALAADFNSNYMFGAAFKGWVKFFKSRRHLIKTLVLGR
jgi:hypothetical protein